METKVMEKLRIAKIMDPLWLEIIDHHLVKDGYTLEVNNDRYATYRKGFFWENLHQVIIKKNYLTYSKEVWHEGDLTSKVSDPLSVTTETGAALIIAMLQFTGAFTNPPFSLDEAKRNLSVVDHFNSEQFTGLSLPV